MKIPISALIYTRDITKVFVISQSDEYPENAYIAIEKNVTLVSKDDDFIYLKITSLNESDSVIIFTTNEIENGDRIVVVTD